MGKPQLPGGRFPAAIDIAGLRVVGYSARWPYGTGGIIQVDHVPVTRLLACD